MDAPIITLNEILDWPAREPAPRRWAKIEASGGVRYLRDGLARFRVPGLWGGTRTEILKKTRDVLSSELFEILARAWRKLPELRRYRDAARYPPERAYLVPLVEHTVRSVHKPQLEIRADGALLGRLHLEVEISVHIRGMMLTVQGGKIRKIAPGDCRASGSFSCEGVRLVRKRSKRLRLPGTIELAEGIEI